MRTMLKFTAPLCLAALGLAACTGETMPDSGDEVSDEVIDETSADLEVSDPVAREEPVTPDLNGEKSAATEQPTLGADAVEADLGSGAEPPNPPGE